MKTLLLLFVLCGQLQANDHSRFNINAGTGDTPTKVHFIVTDSLGRKTGFKSFGYNEDGDFGAKTCKEIPNSGYLTEAIGSLDPSIVPDEPESAVFGVSPVVRDTYTVQFIGSDDCKYHFAINFGNAEGEYSSSLFGAHYNYILKGTTQQYSLYLDPTPGAPTPIIIKTVTFDTLRQDLLVAQKLNQVGDDKFVNSFIKMVNLAEKLAGKCDKHKKDKKCEPAIAVLNMVIKRLGKANQKCDSKDSRSCDEDNDWNDFDKEHRKDHDYGDFFKDWDKDDWHNWKKKCKRFVTDEALKIIKEDVQWLIKSLGGKTDKDHGKGDSDRNDKHSGKEDKKDNR